MFIVIFDCLKEGQGYLQAVRESVNEARE